jgi:hypothetical protein
VCQQGSDIGKLVIEAPDDVFVREITLDGHVRSGQPLALLESPNLDRQRSALLALQEHIAIIERPFRDGRIDEEITTLNTKARSLKDAADFADENVRIAEARHKAGTVHLDVLNTAKISSVQATSAYLDAILSASHAERKKIDLVDKLTSAKNKLSREVTYIDTMKIGLTILFSFNGTFKARVAANAFLKKGQIIGELET